MSRRRPKPPIQVPVASMGDIAFLLIIFFMVCSNFAKEASLKLEPPKSAAIDKLDNSPISVAIDQESKVYVQGQAVGSAEAAREQIAQLLEARQGDRAKTVLFRCDQGVDKETFEPVLDAIAEAGGIIAALGTKTGSR